MPFNETQSAQFVEKELLKFPVGLGAIKSVVLDATDFAVPDTAVRYQVPKGTILMKSATNTDKHIEYKGTGTIDGILRSAVDLLSRATSSCEPAAMLFHGCVFATQSIVGFTNYATNLVAALPTCKFE